MQFLSLQHAVDELLYRHLPYEPDDTVLHALVYHINEETTDPLLRALKNTQGDFDTLAWRFGVPTGVVYHNVVERLLELYETIDHEPLSPAEVSALETNYSAVAYRNQDWQSNRTMGGN